MFTLTFARHVYNYCTSINQQTQQKVQRGKKVSSNQPGMYILSSLFLKVVKKIFQTLELCMSIMP